MKTASETPSVERVLMQRVDRHEDCGRHASPARLVVGDDQEQGHHVSAPIAILASQLR